MSIGEGIKTKPPLAVQRLDGMWNTVGTTR
jgi:hypothetical protein